MSAIMNKANARKTVRDASAEVAKSGGDVADTGRKIAHDASLPGGQPARKVVEASSREVIRKNAEAAEQNLQQAAEELRGTMERSNEMVGNVADTARQASGRVVKQLGQVSATQEKAVNEVTGRTQQNLGVMMQTGITLASGFQSVMQEWADYTRKATQCHIDGMNSIMRARSPQDFMAAQSNLLNAEVHLMLSSRAKIAEATARVAKEASQSISERTHQWNQ